MNENLLQFIWQYSLYQPQSLTTTEGEPITVVTPGKRNTDAGPDFHEARVRIGNTLLVGNIELHVNSSDWLRHGHQHDPVYQNVILHVVYKDDKPSLKNNFPVLELAPHIPAYIPHQYTTLLHTASVLPCSNALNGVNELVKESWLSRLLAERWEMKLTEWKELLEQSAGDWRNLLYWRLAANFGFKTNAAPFLALARSISVNILARHRENLLQIEALLFGQAGFLESDFDEPYPKALKEEYVFLQQKYNLQPLPAHSWKFLRMRPASFPTIRIAQFAAIIHRSIHLFWQITEAKKADEITKLFKVVASSYWDNHVQFGTAQKNTAPKFLGAASVQNIIINTVAPIQFLYALENGTVKDQERALQLLESIPAENNHIIDSWTKHNWKPQNALHSQALIQLQHYYCAAKRCLECSIGLAIIRSRPDK